MNTYNSNSPIAQLKCCMKNKKCIGITFRGEFCNKSVKDGSKFCVDCNARHIERKDIAMKRDKNKRK